MLKKMQRDELFSKHCTAVYNTMRKGFTILESYRGDNYFPCVSFQVYSSYSCTVHTGQANQKVLKDTNTLSVLVLLWDFLTITKI